MSNIPEGAICDCPGGCRINCLATPRASRNALSAWHDNRLKVALAAPPVDGEANKTLVKFMAEVLKVPKSAVSMAGGESSRRKVLAVSGISAAKVAEILSELVK
ncbi:MAG: DUF167 domain-containing protein [Lentisphaerae bacterium]|nr:DUF167 domain-containing protein [Lentisphaerota bacterium]